MRHIKNCPVAVVGGAGFLGSHLVDHLINDRGCEVLVIDNLVAGRREFVNVKAWFAHADITGSEEHLRSLFEEYRIEYVFNYAAYPYVPDSFDRPLHVSNVNFFGAMKVINAAQQAGACGILQVSSAEIYGNAGLCAYGKPGWQPGDTLEPFRLDEDAEVCPHSTYGASKAAVDYFCQVRWMEAKTPVIALRQFNCVGERETHPYVVPEIISQLVQWRLDKDMAQRAQRLGGVGVALEDEPVVLLGNNSFRDFLYAGDQAVLAVELLERGEFGEVYNLGSESGSQIYDLAQTIAKLLGYESVRVVAEPVRMRPWEIWHLQSDNTKIYEVVAVRPQIELAEALRRTILWHHKVKRWPWQQGFGQWGYV